MNAVQVCSLAEVIVTTGDVPSSHFSNKKSSNHQNTTIMTREEYLIKMQEYREQLQEECKKNREALDNLAINHKENIRMENEAYERMVREQRDAHTEIQYQVERKMHELKVQWAKEHPIEEVKVVNND